MKQLFCRTSTITFIIIALLGVFAPVIVGDTPHDIVGAPFSRPIWWKTSTLSSTHFYNVAENGIQINWDKNAPDIFNLTGKITADKIARIIWRTPQKDYIIAEVTGETWLNIDGRDMIFKQSLDLPLVGKSTEYLFPCSGSYSLSFSGAKSADLRLSLYGARNGLLGTDQRGRDVFAMFIYGIRTSLIVGIAATLIASLLGMTLGLVSGYAGGLCDTIIMRIVDILLSIPTLPIMMVLAGIWGKGLWQLVLILSVFSWMGTARSVRSLVLTLRESPWVESLRALGAKRRYILLHHLVPETAPLLLANIALGVPGAILAEAGVAFLGLSDPRLISWGRMLHEAHSFGAFTQGAWWLLLPPGIGIVTICLIFMDLGKYLEEIIDPRLRAK
ncbi:MAG: ABC transporter permease [Synergistes sp.]|nr:ABC transporter permease [Synergistes sp.]